MKSPDLLHLFFDYVDPASFLLEQRIRAREDSALFPLVLEPFELRPPPLELQDVEEEGWSAHWDSMASTAKGMGIRLVRPWIVPWTRKAHELAMHAREARRLREIHDAIFRAYLQGGLDIGRIDVLVALAQDHGLDGSAVKPVLDVDRHAEFVAKKRARALALGVRSVPTLLWRGRTLEGYPDPAGLETFLTSREGHEEP